MPENVNAVLPQTESVKYSHEDYAKRVELPPVPVLHKNIMNDFTPEILMRNHDANLRGVAVVVDEIMGLFNYLLADRCQWKCAHRQDNEV